MERLILQWHITSHCNLRCSHCYQDNFSDKDPSLNNLSEVLEKYGRLLYKLSVSKNSEVKGHINITGGEPFLHPDFFLIAEKIRSRYSLGILTNGTMIDETAIIKLSDLNPAFVQLSIEGDKKIHDTIRGAGNYKKTLSSIKILTGSGIKVYISFTASMLNYKSFPSVAATVKKLGAAKLWSDRFVPVGGASEDISVSLRGENMLEFFKIMKKERDRKHGKIVSMNRALQFQISGKRPYRCAAGSGIIAVMHNGDVYPCRRLPIVTGNAYSEELTDIYYNSQVINDLRNNSTIPEGCSRCSYYVMCGGGAKCQSYALDKNYHLPDPGCPIPGLYKKT